MASGSNTELYLGGVREGGSSSRGQLHIKSNTSTFYTTIYNNSGNALTENRNLYIPDKSGTLAVGDFTYRLKFNVFTGGTNTSKTIELSYGYYLLLGATYNLNVFQSFKGLTLISGSINNGGTVSSKDVIGADTGITLSKGTDCFVLNYVQSQPWRLYIFFLDYQE